MCLNEGMTFHGVHCSMAVFAFIQVYKLGGKRGARSVERGVWSVECGVWSVECGVRGVECGMWSVECGVWKIRSVYV